VTPCEAILPREGLKTLIDLASADALIEVQRAIYSASFVQTAANKTNEGSMLSIIEKIIFLKDVSFFEGMTIDQLKILAGVCEEETFNEDTLIFKEGDPGGVVYVVVKGKVAIEVEGARKGSTSRIATIEANSYFGEMRLFDNSPRSERARAIQDTLTLRLRREPLIALTRQYPDLSLKLINVLSQRLRDANERIAQLTASKPRELQKLYDKLD
jgi:CRP-like cAMP-binding protein